MDAFEPKSDFLRVLRERGYVHQCSDWAGLDAKAASGDLVGYIGFDATGPSLHVGHLLQIYMLHWLQQTGGKPIALMGGGTTMVGDPSGKDETRKILTVEQIEANKANIRKVFGKFMRFGEGRHDAVMPDNADWLTKLNYIEFLRDVGRHFSVNRMLSMDSVKLRLEREQELSFIEFNYMCLQAYDFVELNRRYGCALQMGGSDQWGNIVIGADLGRRLGTPQLYALTSPLITTASGAKMGKTAAGAVWLDAGMLSPYDYWQFWRNTEDADVGRFLKLFTLLPIDEIARLGALAGRGDQRGQEDARDRGDRDAARPRGGRGRRRYRAQDLRGGRRSPRRCRPSTCQLPNSTPARRASAFVRAGLVASTGEARRQIRGGGLRVNDEALADEKALIGRDALRDGVVKLSLGRKKHVLLRVVSPPASSAARSRRNRAAPSVLSARLVRMIGTRAPSTMPATSASARYSSLLRQHVAGFEIGHDENVGLPGHRRHDALGLGGFRRDGVVESERAVEDAAGDLPAVGHLAQRRGIQRRPDFRRHRLDRREDRDLRQRRRRARARGRWRSGRCRACLSSVG